VGVLVCGSGIGMCIAANKFDGVRAAVVQDVVAARLSREHNGANILCVGARFMAPEYATEVVRTFLTTPGPSSKPGDDRHLARIEKIRALEKRRSE
jgi:ribose 5-phosphate isomerase B